MSTTIDQFLGIDERSGERPLGSLAIADNCYVDTRRSLVRRPGLVRRATLPAGTAGLYVHDDTLRCAAPDGTSPAGLFPTLYLDWVPWTSVAGRVEMARLSSGRRAIWVESVNGSLGLGGIAVTVADPATAGGEVISTPDFTPVGVLLMTGRLYSLDPEGSRMRWSGQDDPDETDGKGFVTSWNPAAKQVDTVAVTAGGTGYTDGSTITSNTPTSGRAASGVITVVAGAITAVAITDNGFGFTAAPTWTVAGGGTGATFTTALGSAIRAQGGFVSLAQGSSAPQGLYEYRNGIAAILRSSIQIWNITGDGATGIGQQIAGPGTRHPGSVQAMSGDLVYLDPGFRFRTISTDATTVLPAEDTIGSPVAKLVRTVLPAASTPVALYSRVLGLYLGAWHNRMMVLSVSPGEGEERLGWTTWTLPADVEILGMTECRGTIYLRGETELWSLELNAPDDEVADGDHRGITVDVETTEMIRSKDPVTIHETLAILTGSASLAIVKKGVAGRFSPLTGSAPDPCRKRSTHSGRSLGIHLTATNAGPDWRLDGLALGG